jgi:transcriptional/translational regulatory protein YebC/TACO1
VEPTYYEVYGPGGSAMMIEAFTDNNNRTSNQLKHILGKRGLGLGQPGSERATFLRLATFSLTRFTMPRESQAYIPEARIYRDHIEANRY